MRHRLVVIAPLLIGTMVCHASTQPDKGGLRSAWAPDPDMPLPEHPRPHLVRDGWINLNGKWNYAITDGTPPAGTWDGTILVPFPVESALSGVQRPLAPDQTLWYQRTVNTPRIDQGGRVLLHFAGVDWRTDVWVNQVHVGSHEGGYDAFSFDITEAIGSSSTIDILVGVHDPTDAGVQPRGKQVRTPGGIWYTAVSGIWQTVWLETVPTAWIDDVRVHADPAQGVITIEPSVRGAKIRADIEARVLFEGELVASASGPSSRLLRVAVSEPRLWSPDDPALYDIELALSTPRGVVDAVRTYTGFRTIEMRADDQGVNRLFLNGEVLFQFGPLDQGWWPDGLYTAPTDEALRSDIEQTRAMGFNMSRKHVKVEPQRWYYWADKLGLLVWQDMPSGDGFIGAADPDLVRSEKSESIFRTEWSEIIREFGMHPSIVVWVPFNEGWGQFKTNEILAWTKSLDPSRLVDGPSGWADRGSGDLHDMHAYPGPGMFPIEPGRASVLGEFGGLGLVVPGHVWQEDRNWGYRSFDSAQALAEAYEQLISRLRPLIGKGLSAAVYTQLTDVEIEVNGLMTYDRKITKLDPAWLARVNERVYLPPPVMTTIVPTSEQTAQSWRFTTTDPGEGWFEPTFDDSDWSTGPGGFGTAHTPGSVVGTEWNTTDIWIRRTVEIDRPAPNMFIRMHHDEDAQLYINGSLVMEARGWTTGYAEFGPIKPGVLVAGTNTIAVHCHQTSGGQFIDVGIVQMDDPAAPSD